MELLKDIQPSIIQAINSQVAWNYNIIPFSNQDGILKVFAVHTKISKSFIEELEFVTGKKIETEPCEEDYIQELLVRYYRKSQREGKLSVSVDFNKAGSFVEDLVKEAKDLGSSDIHLEPFETECRVRIRIDGKLIEKYTLATAEYPSIVNKLKIKANLDIAEKRLPQDGRINFRDHNDQFDIRVSVLPTLHGEKVVLRILNQDASNLDIHKLGFGEDELKAYLESVKKPHGIILISGPTGSGKTTTLYATLKLLNKGDVNICTVEDPIEYTLKGINQVQVKDTIGLSFASALKSFLRQDPDIIMLGEIRDGETANMAVRAALTGHLVLSTIHTNSAWDTIARLMDMGVPPFLIATTLNLSAAQRLVRRLCKGCKKEAAFVPELLPSGFKPNNMPSSHFTPVGCSECFYTGYKGRIAIYELIPINQNFFEAIKGNPSDKNLLEKNIELLKDKAYKLICEGETSIEEVYSILLN